MLRQVFSVNNAKLWNGLSPWKCIRLHRRSLSEKPADGPIKFSTSKAADMYSVDELKKFNGSSGQKSFARSLSVFGSAAVLLIYTTIFREENNWDENFAHLDDILGRKKE